MKDQSCAHPSIAEHVNPESREKFYICTQCKEQWRQNLDGTVTGYEQGPGTRMKQYLQDLGMPPCRECRRREFAMNLWGDILCSEPPRMKVISEWLRSEAMSYLLRGHMQSLLEAWLLREILDLPPSDAKLS